MKKKFEGLCVNAGAMARHRKYVFRKIQAIIVRQAEIVFREEQQLRAGAPISTVAWVKYMDLELRKKKLMEGL